MAAQDQSSSLLVFHFDFNHISLRPDYIRRWLKQLADMGYNAILWELEDKIQWETCPEIVWPEAMSKDEFRSILEYSRELGLEPIPLLQTVGHGEYVMKHEKYHSFREDPNYYDCYCTSNPEVRTFLKSLITEYLDLFGDLRYFHLGGDEAYVFGTCPTCKAAADKTSRNRLYAEHINDLAKPIFERNVKPGIWCDMVLHYPQEVDEISRDFVIWDWNYWGGVEEPEVIIHWGFGHKTKDQLTPEILEQAPEMLDDQGRLNTFWTTDVLAKHGFEIFLCSSSRSAGDTVFCGRHKIHSSNVVAIAQKAKKAGILGQCVTSWAIRLHSLELQKIWIELAALADANPETDFKELLDSYGRTLFGVDPAEFYEAIDLIAEQMPIAVTCSHWASGIQWTTLKDSMPTPPGFMKDILTKWKTETDGKEYKHRVECLETATKNIPAGLEKLKAFAQKATTGKDTIDQWLSAGDFQLRMLKIVQAVFKAFESGTLESVDQIIADTEKLKADYEKHNSDAMTPESAKLNTSLTFDHVIEFFNDMKA